MSIFERTNCVECISDARKLANVANSTSVSSRGRYTDVFGSYIATALSVDSELGSKLALGLASGVDQQKFVNAMLTNEAQRAQCNEMYTRINGLLSNQRRAHIDNEIAHILSTQ